MDELEELRRLLLSREQEQIRILHDRFENKGKRARDVSEVLPEALALSSESAERLAEALRPMVEHSIKQSIKKSKDIFIEAFHPIMGELIRRSIAEKFRDLMQRLNQSLQHTFSWQGLKWRFEALRTGRSFAEVVLLRSLLYRVEQLFLVHRKTGLAILHVSDPMAISQDSDMVAAMLSAIQDFARDSFTGVGGASLEEVHIGELQLWIIPGSSAYLAAGIRGNPPRELHTTLEEALESAHTTHGEELANFEGDASVFEPLRPRLEACLREQHQPRNEGEMRLTYALLTLTVVASLVAAAGIVLLHQANRWHRFIERLNEEPGLAVTSDARGWLGSSHIHGLRDPLAADPASIARDAGYPPDRIDFHWKEYLALDAPSVQRRFEQRFGRADGLVMAVNSGAVELYGVAPYEWIERVRREATLVPGVSSLKERNLTVAYDPALVLQRFQAAFPLPAGATARVEKKTVVLAGQATYEWIAPVRAGATRLPGITSISERELQVIFNPALVLQRFADRFTMPEDVRGAVSEGKLTLSGEASHAWLLRVRAAAAEVPGITQLDDQQVADLDERTFQKTKSVIEAAVVYFLPAKDDFASEGFAALSRLPDEIRQCDSAARHLGLDLTIEIRGQADATGLSEKNADLSRRRAEAVNNFLVQCGLPAPLFKPLAMGAPSAAPETPDVKPAGEQSQRRVAFRVISQAVSARP